MASGIERKGMGKKTRIVLLVLAGLGIIEIAGAVITDQTNDQPGVIYRVIEDIKWPITLTENLLILKVPDTFNNNAEKTKFGENNVTKITVEEAEAKDLLEPKIRIDSSGKAVITTLLPGLFTASVPDTELNVENHAEKEQTPYTHAYFIMPEGYRLTLPKGTHYVLFEADKVPNQQPDLVYTIGAFYFDPTNNVSLMLSFETGGFKPEPGQKITAREDYNREFSPSRGGNFEKLPKSDGKTVIAAPVTPNQRLHIYIDAIKGQIRPYKSLQDAQANSMESLWENFVDQNQKLILISSK
jgi:hypothetical protein